MNIMLIAARAYQCQTGCSNAQAVAYVYAIKKGADHRIAGKWAPKLGRDLLLHYGIMRGDICSCCHKSLRPYGWHGCDC